MNKQKQSVPWEQPISQEAAQRIWKTIYECFAPDKDLRSVRLLDFGAGNGRYLHLFAEKIPKKNLWGAEIDKGYVDLLSRDGFNVVLLNNDQDKLYMFEDGFFDIVFSSNVLEHIPCEKYLSYLSEISRIVNKGGIFLVGMPNYPAKRIYDLFKAVRQLRNFKYYFFDDPTHVNKISIHRFSRDLKRFFSEVSLIPSFYLFQSLVDKFSLSLDQDSKISLFCDKYFGYAKK